MKEGGLLFIVIGVFIILLIMLAYVKATYGGTAFWLAFAFSLIGIGITLLIAFRDYED